MYTFIFWLCEGEKITQIRFSILDRKANFSVFLDGKKTLFYALQQFYALLQIKLFLLLEVFFYFFWLEQMMRLEA
jgi:hypothetical protein